MTLMTTMESSVKDERELIRRKARLSSPPFPPAAPFFARGSIFVLTPKSRVLLIVVTIHFIFHSPVQIPYLEGERANERAREDLRRLEGRRRVADIRGRSPKPAEAPKSRSDKRIDLNPRI